MRVSFTLDGRHPKDIVNMSEGRILDATIGLLQTLTLRDVDTGSVKNRIRADLVEQINRALESAPAYNKDKDFPGSYPAGATDLVPDWGSNKVPKHY